MKKLLLIQPGACGDIILCAPIARYYSDKGYEVHWPITKRFFPLLDQLDYVSPIILNDNVLDHDWLRSDVMKIIPLIPFADKVVNLADRGPHPTAETPPENFEQCKYRLAGVPIENKHKLKWSRNLDRENSLYETVVGDKKDYAFCHLTSSRNDRAEMPEFDGDVVEASEIDGYSIYDWYKVIKNASAIYCVESAIHQFIDGFIASLVFNTKCYTLPRGAYQKKGGDCYSPFWDKRYMT